VIFPNNMQMFFPFQIVNDPVFPIFGDQQRGNLNSLLYNNIQACQYFTDVCMQMSYPEIVQQIVQNVNYIEPWAVGTTGVPSTLFCCLYRLMTLKLTESQVKFLINKKEFPYLRCAGFLYIRFLIDPKDLWSRLSPYLFDQQSFYPILDQKNTITIGEYVENLLKQYDYYNTRLPKIPTNLERELKAKLAAIQSKRNRRKENEKNYNLLVEGEKCLAYSIQDNYNEMREGIIVGNLPETKQIIVRFKGSDEVERELIKTENRSIYHI
jgi:pre-mRNA-splicing factor 38B